MRYDVRDIPIYGTLPANSLNSKEKYYIMLDFFCEIPLTIAKCLLAA